MMKLFWCLFILLFCKLSILNSQPKYEFRAAWIATVNNIDWPSSKNLSAFQQQQEFINIITRLRQIGINAVIVQIRPAADAFYPSSYEPWSEYLTGRQGVAPSPYYDPLQFMIDETHKRGMEFHAWINPYRAMQTLTTQVASNHITKQHPEWFLNYGDKKYFNPGLPEVRNYLTNVVIDILKRYDIDGLHMDDYFYPYRIAGKEFPDGKTFAQYGNGLTKDDWRRSNCDSIVKMVHNAVIEYKPYVKFGISPFGVWRNSSIDARGSDTRAGQTCYDDLYADVLLWLKEGWIDYVVPQIYWEINSRSCDYATLLDWWSANSYGKQLYIGHGVYRAIEKPTPAWRNPNEIPNQIKLLRNDENVQGSVFYSSRFLLDDPNGWADSLRFNYYRTPALIAPMNWIDTTAPQRPHVARIEVGEQNNIQQFTVSGDGINKNETEVIKNFVVYISNTPASLTDHPFIIIPADASLKFQFLLQSSLIPVDWNYCYVAVTSVDRQNNESEVSNVILLQKNNMVWEVKK
jgi:uncharacterized lipoprotein YddW (UPF0748 family)